MVRKSNAGAKRIYTRRLRAHGPCLFGSGGQTSIGEWKGRRSDRGLVLCAPNVREAEFGALMCGVCRGELHLDCFPGPRRARCDSAWDGISVRWTLPSSPSPSLRPRTSVVLVQPRSGAFLSESHHLLVPSCTLLLQCPCHWLFHPDWLRGASAITYPLESGYKTPSSTTGTLQHSPA